MLPSPFLYVIMYRGAGLSLRRSQRVENSSAADSGICVHGHICVRACACVCARVRACVYVAVGSSVSGLRQPGLASRNNLGNIAYTLCASVSCSVTC